MTATKMRNQVLKALREAGCNVKPLRSMPGQSNPYAEWQTLTALVGNKRSGRVVADILAKNNTQTGLWVDPTAALQRDAVGLRNDEGNIVTARGYGGSVHLRITGPKKSKPMTQPYYD